MKTFSLLFVLLLSAPAFAQVEVTAGPNQEAMLQSDDPKLAANKRLVFDFWRIVLDAHRVDQAEKYMVEDYIQHNPNVPTGRAAFVGYFGSMISGPQRRFQDVHHHLVRHVPH